LDHHSSHLSKETRASLATRLNRLVYVHTPKHGSWLNLVETLFGKMSRPFLKAIRVGSWEEPEPDAFVPAILRFAAPRSYDRSYAQLRIGALRMLDSHWAKD
jgi:transposase